MISKNQEYEVLTIFSEVENQLTSSLTNTAAEDHQEYSNIDTTKCTVQRLFPGFLWDQFKILVLDKFIIFRQICSIIIGILTVDVPGRVVLKSARTLPLSLECLTLKKFAAPLAPRNP